LAVVEVVAAVDAGAVRRIHEVGGGEAGEAKGGHFAGVAAPEGVGAEEAVTSGVGKVLGIVLGRAVSADGVRNAGEAVGVEEAAVIILGHAECEEEVGGARGNTDDRAAWKIIGIVLNSVVCFVVIDLEPK
jgi:hypothetical protein